MYKKTALFAAIKV